MTFVKNAGKQEKDEVTLVDSGGSSLSVLAMKRI